MRTLLLLLLCAVALAASPPWLETRLTNSPRTARLTYNFGRSLAVDARGRAHLVWFDQPPDGDGEHLLTAYYRRSPDGGVSWDEAIPLTSREEGYHDSGYPVVASTGELVYVAYRGKRPGVIGAFLRASRDGGRTFDVEVQVSTGNQVGPVTLAADGLRVQLAWVDERDGTAEVYSRHSDDGGRSWGPEQRLTPLPSNSWVPSLAMAGDQVYLAWVDFRNGYEQEYFRASRDGGRTWEPEQAVTSDPHDHWAPCLAAEGQRVYLSWFDRSDCPVTEREVNDVANDLLARVGLPPEPPLPPRTSDAGDYVGLVTTLVLEKVERARSLSPSLDVRGFQELFQRWQSGWRVVLRISEDGGVHWGPVRVVNGSGLRPSLAVQGDDLRVAWFDGPRVLTAHSADRGRTWETPRLLSSTGTLAHAGPDLVVWVDSRGAHSEIYSSRVARPSDPTRTLNVPLHPGWNPVAIGTVDVMSAVIPGAVKAMAHLEGGSYALSPPAAEGLRGALWLYADGPGLLTYTGHAATSARVGLQAGWNLVAFPFSGPLPGRAPVLPVAHQINQDGSLTPLDLWSGEVQAGVPYWIYAGEDCSL